MDQPLISVFCAAYNHARYIEQTIKSIIDQETNFPYEIIIHDDASKDKTADIIRKYESRYPNVIRGIYQEENQFIKGKRFGFEIIRQYARGKYIAFCEGDDYWVNRKKLQKQVEILEKNKHCTMVLHNAYKLDCVTNQTEIVTPHRNSGYIEAKDIILQPHGHPATASMICRRSIIDNLTGFYMDVCVGDYPIQLEAILQGKIYYYSEIMSVYRYKTGGSYSCRLGRDLSFKFNYYINLCIFLLNYNRHSKGVFSTYVKDKIYGLAYPFINMIDYNVSVIDCIEKNIVIGKELILKEQPFLIELERIRQLVFDLDIVDKKLFRLCKDYEAVFIMGAGKFAAKLANQLDRNKINYMGFVVSSKLHNPKEYFGKPVYQLDEMPWENNKYGLIIGIYPKELDQIYKSLHHIGLNNVYCPFALDENIFAVSTT